MAANNHLLLPCLVIPPLPNTLRRQRNIRLYYYNLYVYLIPFLRYSELFVVVKVAILNPPNLQLVPHPLECVH